MGLDMYLYQDIYIGAVYNHNEVKGTIDIEKEGEKIDIDLSKVESIRLRFAYWRKSNQVHKWFVDNVQSGIDDCREHYVSGKKLKELVELCKKVLENHSLAEELLPTCSGFYFGSEDYDQYYFEDLQSTVNQLEEIEEDADYYYQSSW